MQAKPILCLAAAFFLFTAQQAHALSAITQIKTNDIQNFVSFIKIKAQDEPGGGKRFRVIFTRYSGVNPENVSGYLNVCQGKKSVVQCMVHGARLDLKSNEVAPSDRSKSRVFEFFVASDHLSDSKFELNISDPDRPGFDDYWFYLKDFVDAK
jgi:hypothetical protein